MLYYYLLFFFVAFGAKLVLALLMIYWLLPSERSCSQCDEQTLFIRPPPVPRALLRLGFGRLQWRWCPHCGSEGMVRSRGSRGYLTEIPVLPAGLPHADHNTEQ